MRCILGDREKNELVFVWDDTSFARRTLDVREEKDGIQQRSQITNPTEQSSFYFHGLSQPELPFAAGSIGSSSRGGCLAMRGPSIHDERESVDGERWRGERPGTADRADESKSEHEISYQLG